MLATGKRASAEDSARKLMQRSRKTRTVHALRGVSFTAYESDSVGVIGSNGSGKSTLMRAIVGLTPTSQGSIYASSRPSMLGVGAALIRDLKQRTCLFNARDCEREIAVVRKRLFHQAIQRGIGEERPPALRRRRRTVLRRIAPRFGQFDCGTFVTRTYRATRKNC